MHDMEGAEPVEIQTLQVLQRRVERVIVLGQRFFDIVVDRQEADTQDDLVEDARADDRACNGRLERSQRGALVIVLFCGAAGVVDGSAVLGRAFEMDGRGHAG